MTWCIWSRLRGATGAAGCPVTPAPGLAPELAHVGEVERAVLSRAGRVVLAVLDDRAVVDAARLLGHGGVVLAGLVRQGVVDPAALVDQSVVLGAGLHHRGVVVGRRLVDRHAAGAGADAAFAD